MPAIDEYKCNKCGSSKMLNTAFPGEPGHSDIKCGLCSKTVNVDTYADTVICPACGGDPIHNFSYDPNVKMLDCIKCDGMMEVVEDSRIWMMVKKDRKVEAEHNWKMKIGGMICFIERTVISSHRINVPKLVSLLMKKYYFDESKAYDAIEAWIKRRDEFKEEVLCDLRNKYALYSSNQISGTLAVGLMVTLLLPVFLRLTGNEWASSFAIGAILFNIGAIMELIYVIYRSKRKIGLIESRSEIDWSSFYKSDIDE